MRNNLKIGYFVIILAIIFQHQFLLYAANGKFQTINGVLHNYDVLHYKIEIHPDELKESLHGNTGITFVPLIDSLKQVSFHACDLLIKDVSLLMNNAVQRLNFKSDSQTVAIHFSDYKSKSDTLTIAIEYLTFPEYGVFFHSPGGNVDSTIAPQIYSDNEPEDARYWFPCFDAPFDKASSELLLTVDSSYITLSNGEPVNVQINHGDGTKTHHWRQQQPHSTYLVCFAAGKYQHIGKQWHDLALNYYFYPSQRDYAMLTFKNTARMLDIFTKKFQTPYPWPKYSQIVVYNFDVAGMENTSATFLTDRSLFDRRMHFDRNRDALIAHELAHQWFGNLVTCSDWANLWINEGFATYAEFLYYEDQFGMDAARFHLLKDREQYLDEIRIFGHYPIIRYDYELPMDMFNSFVYNKGAWVLHTLRFVIGDSLFFESLKQFLREFAYSNASAGDFQRTVERVCSSDLNRFFNQWLYQTGHPEFDVSYSWNQEDSVLALCVKQQQALDSTSHSGCFKTPVNIEIQTAGDTLLERIFVHQSVDTFRFCVDSEPLLVRFDKNSWILKTLTFKKSCAELCYQLAHDDDVTGRLAAIKQLVLNLNEEKTVSAFCEAVLSDPFWAVREQAADVLINSSDPAVPAVYRKGCFDSSAKVRRMCVKGLGSYKDEVNASIFRNLIAADSSYFVIKAALEALADTKDSSTYKIAALILDDEKQHQIVKKGALRALRILGDKRATSWGLQYAAFKQPLELRYEALNLLSKVAEKKQELELFLIDLLYEYNERIVTKAINILGELQSARALPILLEYAENSTKERIRIRAKKAVNLIESSKKLK